MATKTETILLAVFAALNTVAGAVVVRNAAPPGPVAAGGLIFLSDGPRRKTDQTLGAGGSIWWERDIEIEVIAGDGNEAGLDALVAAVGAAVEADITFGGLVDELVDVDDDRSSVDEDGVERLLGARITMTIGYETSSEFG